MFLEKNSRFFRQYEISLSARHSKGIALPFVSDNGDPSVLAALELRIAAEKALTVQANADIIELMRVVHRTQENALVLLFHRASPNASDPTYRKKARKGMGVTVRQAKRLEGEEPAVSAHLVIDLKKNSSGSHRAILEEIPGLSMAAVKQVITQALMEYKYDCTDGDKSVETHCVFKAEGIKSESLSDALTSGRMKFLTLSRQAEPEFVDADGLFVPTQEFMKIRINREADLGGWLSRLKTLITGAVEAGWETFNVEIDNDNNRQKTVKIEREQEAKEIFFVKSELKSLPEEIPTCTPEIIDSVVLICKTLIEKK